MGRVKKKPVLALLCLVLSILTILAMMPGMAFADAEEKAETGSGTSANTQVENSTSGSTDLTTPTSDSSGSSTGINWNHSKSKTATTLDKNYTSEVTLSLPSKEEQLDSDIVFVMDKSSCKAETSEKMKGLLNQLNTSLKNSGAQVKLAIVAFDGTDHEIYPLTQFESGQIDTITSKVSEGISAIEHVSGTNMHAGLLKAGQILDQDSSVSANRKYMIVVSDGLTRLFNGSDGKVKDIYYQGQYSWNGLYGMIDEWSAFRFGKNDYYNPYTNNPNWTWQEYWENVKKWVEKDNNTYVHDFDQYGNDATGKVDPSGFTHLTDTGKDSASEHAMAVDRAVYEAYNAYEKLVSSGYRCYAVQVGKTDSNNPGTEQKSEFGAAFMGALNTLSRNDGTVDFNVIKNDICYLVGAGSTVTDSIGYKENAYNFDLIDPSQMKVEIDDDQGNTQSFDAEKIDENHYGFKPKTNEDGIDDGYAYEVTYTPGDKKAGEQLVWKTNVPITNFQHVSLKYKVKLTDPKTAPGTYGQLDLNGDGIIDGTNTAVESSKAIYTNASAVLVPKDSAGTEGTHETFGNPSVSYTIENPTPTEPTTPTNPTTPTTPTKPAKPEEHIITFQPNNGQPTFTQTVPDGGQAVVPDQPTRKGYTFEGWYTDSELTKAYDFSTPVRSDFTLYAKWKPEKVTPTPKPKPVKPAKKKVTGILLPKVIAKGKHTQVFTWTALKNVDGYFIYTNRCDEDMGRIPHPFKKVADYKASKKRVYTKKHLTTYRNYKYYVAAYKIKNGKKVIVRNSVTVHSVCGNTSARSTNVKAVKAAKHAITLKKGQSYKLKASIYKINKSRAFLDTTHCGLIRYLSRDKKIATVDYNTGKIKGVKAGTTKVYVLGVNGIRDRITVTVK